MKNQIIYNYKLNPEYLNIKENEVTFYIDYSKYILYKLDRPIDDIKEITSILNNNKTKYHNIILNKDNNQITEIKNIPYLLIKLNTEENREIDIYDILKNNIQASSTILNRSNWSQLWSEKVDYLEYQIKELSSPHPIIKKSFYYYIGLAENAIEYFNLLIPNNLATTIQHKRVVTNTKEFYNPLNIIIDYRVRDIASYIKYKFFNEDSTTLQKEINTIVKKAHLTSLEYNLLFTRLLYPSYYFDTLHQVLEHNKDEESLLYFIKKTSEYEKFLSNIYLNFSTITSMIKIEWLIK